MGRKVHPVILRVGINKNWKSNWFAGKDYQKFLHEDIAIRKFIFKKLPNAGISEIKIERSQNLIKITVYTSRPGIVIGRKGSGIEDLRFDLEKITDKKTVNLNIEEIRKPELDAFLVASNVASQLERRISYRRAGKQTLSRTMEAGAKGIKIKISGRLGGAEIARKETFNNGKMPLHTFRSDIDYAYVPAHTTYGVIGIKVWIYKGEVFRKRAENKSKSNEMEILDVNS